MADACFSRETLERFFLSELSREESRDFVRHLLRQCPQCSRLVREAAQRDSFQLLLRGLEEAALRSEPAPERPATLTLQVDPILPSTRRGESDRPRRHSRLTAAAGSRVRAAIRLYLRASTDSPLPRRGRTSSTSSPQDASVPRSADTVAHSSHRGRT